MVLGGLLAAVPHHLSDAERSSITSSLLVWASIVKNHDQSKVVIHEPKVLRGCDAMQAIKQNLLSVESRTDDDDHCWAGPAVCSKLRCAQQDGPKKGLDDDESLDMDESYFFLRLVSVWRLQREKCTYTHKCRHQFKAMPWPNFLLLRTLNDD